MAQAGFYVPRQGKIFFTGDSAAIFSNVLNEGVLGVGQKAVLHFKGQQWQNDPQALLTDESNGGLGVSGTAGWIRFSADNSRQRLAGGYNAATRQGPVFARLDIQNRLGVELEESSAKVGQEIRLSQGPVYLNGQLFVAGHNAPGLISGYDSTRFFVTGPAANGGLLLREGITASDGLVIFPVGTNPAAYTPAALQSHSSLPDHYYVSVMDGVRSGVLSGNNLAERSVKKTWQIGKLLRSGLDEVDVYLQHLNKDEGGLFRQGREKAYVSQYWNNAWDTGAPQMAPVAGYLVEGAPLVESGVNGRSFRSSLTAASYFTKFTGTGDNGGVTKLILGAYRENSTTVPVNWQTRPEFNVQYFVVERRHINEADFYSVDTVASMARGGMSLDYLNYGIRDANNYRGISFYRLKIVDYSGGHYYSNTVAVGGAGFYRVLLWPNPTTDQFFMIINSPEARQLVIFNAIGQKMYSMPVRVAAQTYVEVKGHRLIPGTYFVSIINHLGQIIETEKLLIVPK